MYLNHTKCRINKPTLILPGSKSESNRALILKQFLKNLDLSNLSNADDTLVLKQVLEQGSGTINIGHAGTAMRFLTAYYATLHQSDVVLTGSTRMQERPIKPLVEALLTLGADITYTKQNGYPPIRIKGKTITKHTVSIKAGVSSQYISALMLVAPFLEHGLTINLVGTVTSMPYLTMTVELMKSLDIEIVFTNNQIVVKPYDHLKHQAKTVVIESDWSAISYHYSALALADLGSQMTLKYFKPTSLQGDHQVRKIYKSFGVETQFLADDSIVLTKSKVVDKNQTLHLNLNDTPDLAQTIIVTCAGLGIKASLSGLHTLKIKETDRLSALKTELEKLGSTVSISNDTIVLNPPEVLKPNVCINTYNDHRMAMAFAPLSAKVPLNIENSEVVSKSYPCFWDNWKKMYDLT